MMKTKKSWFSRSLASFLALLMCLSMISITAFAAGSDPVYTLMDENLRKAICAQLDKGYTPGVTVTQAEMASLTELSAENMGITNVMGLEFATNLEILDLSGNNLGKADGMMFSSDKEASAYLTTYLSMLPKLKEVDLSDNYFSATLYFYDYPLLETMDLSGNRINGIEMKATNLPSIKNVNLSDNCFYQNESTLGYSAIMELGIEKFDLTNQKNLASLYGVYVKGANDSNFTINRRTTTVLVNDQTNEIDIGEVLGDKVTFACIGYAPDSTVKVTINENKYTAIASDSSANSVPDGGAVSLNGLTVGINVITLDVMHMNGDSLTYTLKVKSNPLPDGSEVENSAGISDCGLQNAVCTKLKKTAATYVVTKEDMASLTGALTVYNASSLDGLQYATNLGILYLENGTFDTLPEFSSKLTFLKIESSEITELPASLNSYTSLGGLSINAPKVSALPALDATALTSILVGQLTPNTFALAEFSALPTTLSEISLRNCTEMTALPESLKKCTNLSKIELDNTAVSDYSAIKNVPDAQLTLSISNQKNAVILNGMADNNTIASLRSLIVDNCENVSLSDTVKNLPNLENLQISNSQLAVFPESFSASNKITTLNLRNNILTEIPASIRGFSRLTTLDLTNNLLTNADNDLSGLTALTTLNLSKCGLNTVPTSIKQLTTLTSLDLSQNNITSLGDVLDNLSNLETLKISVNNFLDFPDSISKLTGLKTLIASSNPYITVPYAPFENLSALKTIQLGGALKTKALDEQTTQTIATLKSRGVSVNMTTSGNAGCLKSLTVEGYGEIPNVTDPVRGKESSTVTRTIQLSAETTTLTLTAITLYDDTVISVNGVAALSGEPFTVNGLVEGINKVTIIAKNPYTAVALTYDITVVVGSYATEGFPQEGKYYQIPVKALKENESATSMTNNYITQNVIVSYKDGQYRVDLTTTQEDYIPSMRYQNIDGTYVDALEISRNSATHTASWRMFTDNLEDYLFISPYVTPMGYSPVCRLQFDLTQIVDITNTMPTIDRANLNIAINKAIAITEKRNVYTNDSYNTMLIALETAQKAVENDLLTQTQVNAAEEALTKAITVGEGGLVIDNAKLANKTELKAAVDAAKALVKGNHTDTAWEALQGAITDAQTVYDTLEASQSETDSAAKSLNTAVTLFQNSGDASALDKDKLTDGVYSVYGSMIKTNRTENSMSNDAINHYIKLTVKDGEYSLTMDFHGLAYLNKFGYLAELSYYDNGYSYGQYGTVEGTRIPAEVLSTQKNTDGSDLYDEFNQAGGSYEGKLYPDQIQFPLVSDALADKDGFVPLHVFVPVMEDISVGTGDQDVLLKLDWSTLKETTEEDPDFKPEDPVEQSPAVDFTDSKTGVKVYADKGVFEEGTKIVVTEITKGTDYDNAASSLADAGKKFKLYDVKFYDADGNEVTPNGTVEISFPISDGYIAGNCAVYRMNDGGTKTLVKGAVQSDYYTVVTKVSGKYSLVEKESTITDSQNTINQNANIPKTGSISNLSTFALLALASTVMITVLGINKKRKKNNGE